MYKKVFKQMFSVILCLCILLSVLATTVSALTVGTSYDFNEKYTSIDYNWGTNYIAADGKYHSSHGEICMRTLKTDGKPIYCLEPNEKTSGHSATAAELNNTPAWTKLSRSAQQGITWASIYGYKGGNNFTIAGKTYTKTDAYVATQMLIWEWQTARRTSVTASSSSQLRNAIPTNTNAYKCYAAILDACKNHDKNDKPSFSPTSVKLKGTGESNAVTVNSSISLNDFEITSTPDTAKQEERKETIHSFGESKGSTKH